jgi:positive regulator of sigma E activity
MDGGSDQSVPWTACGRSFPRSEAVFFSQLLLIFIVVITALFNLTTESEHYTMWTALLSSCLGYVMPHPRIKKDKPAPALH